MRILILISVFLSGCLAWIDRPCADQDEDGFVEEADDCVTKDAGETDCNDLDESIYPGAIEYCNEVDDNCDGVVDEDCVIPT